MIFVMDMRPFGQRWRYGGVLFWKRPRRIYPTLVAIDCFQDVPCGASNECQLASKACSEFLK